MQITLKGQPIHTSGELPAIHSFAPDFTLTNVELGEVHLKDYLGKKIVLNIFPSLDTPVCALAMQRFNTVASTMPDLLVFCISADLPFAQKRFCSSAHLENVRPVSVFRHPQFGLDYGVLIKDGPLAGLLARAVVLIDTKGKVAYTEQVAEITSEPDYDKLLVALK